MSPGILRNDPALFRTIIVPSLIKMVDKTNYSSLKNQCRIPQWITETEILTFLKTQIAVKQQKCRNLYLWGRIYTETVATALTMKLNAKSTIIAKSEKILFPCTRSVNALKKTMSNMKELQPFCTSINETKELEEMTSSKLDQRTRKRSRHNRALKILFFEIIHGLRNPQGKRKRGRPKNSWRRDMEKEMKVLGKNWKELQQLAEKRRLWRLFVDGPCSNLEPRA